MYLVKVNVSKPYLYICYYPFTISNQPLVDNDLTLHRVLVMASWQRLFCTTAAAIAAAATAATAADRITCFTISLSIEFIKAQKKNDFLAARGCVRYRG